MFMAPDVLNGLLEQSTTLNAMNAMKCIQSARSGNHEHSGHAYPRAETEVLVLFDERHDNFVGGKHLLRIPFGAAKENIEYGSDVVAHMQAINISSRLRQLRQVYRPRVSAPGMERHDVNNRPLVHAIVFGKHSKRMLPGSRGVSRIGRDIHSW